MSVHACFAHYKLAFLSCCSTNATEMNEPLRVLSFCSPGGAYLGVLLQGCPCSLLEQLLPQLRIWPALDHPPIVQAAYSQLHNNCMLLPLLQYAAADSCLDNILNLYSQISLWNKPMRSLHWNGCTLCKMPEGTFSRSWRWSELQPASIVLRFKYFASIQRTPLASEEIQGITTAFVIWSSCSVLFKTQHCKHKV